MVYAWYGTCMAQSKFELCSKLECVRFVTSKKTLIKSTTIHCDYVGQGSEELRKLEF